MLVKEQDPWYGKKLSELFPQTLASVTSTDDIIRRIASDISDHYATDEISITMSGAEWLLLTMAFHTSTKYTNKDA